MGLDFAYIGGQTPLDEDEKEGLLIPAISIRAQMLSLKSCLNNLYIHGARAT